MVLDKLMPNIGGVGIFASNLEMLSDRSVTSVLVLLSVLLTTPVKVLVPSKVMRPPAVMLVGPVATVSLLLVPWVILPFVAVRS